MSNQLQVEIIKQRGVENITAEELIETITPKGRGKFSFYAAHTNGF